jgi:hypothetical protein
MKSNKVDKIMLDIYRELYKNSTPPADFDELMKTEEVNEFGQKIIHYMDYEIDETLFEGIVKENLKGKRIPKWERDVIRRSVLMGCSPKFKK